MKKRIDSISIVIVVEYDDKKGKPQRAVRECLVRPLSDLGLVVLEAEAVRIFKKTYRLIQEDMEAQP